MDSLSVVITSFNFADVIERALTSTAVAVDRFHEEMASSPPVETLVLDDGSNDGSAEVIRRFCDEHSAFRPLMLPRDPLSNPARSRNTGVRETSGSLIAFLDGDDEFLPDHLVACWTAMQDPDVGFVKTRVRLSNVVHPYWREHLETNCLSSNLCVRRTLHNAVGGVPDAHLFRRSDGEAFVHAMDLYRGREDVEYLILLGSRGRRLMVERETVVHYRRPGNTFDVQYGKLSRAPGEFAEPIAHDVRFKHALGRAHAGLMLHRPPP